ncbi:MAG: UvrD-helicase domain-containing protein [Anaerolineae bacterium]
MSEVELTPEQKRICLLPIGDPRTIFLEGPAGCGKTTVAVQRLLYLLDVGVRADQILVWVPQRSFGRPYIEALRQPTIPAGARVDVLSVDGLARRMLDLFWPVIAERAGFNPTREPIFLTLETAQYYLDQVLEPFIQEGAFGDVTVPRNRLLSQIIDNLNKAALVGFPHTEIATRLSAAWSGPSSRQRVYEAAQRAASAFREHCLQHNLLDFSLQVETFIRHVWPQPECKAYLLQRYRHLIADNLEEDIPVAHDLLQEWLEQVASALLVYDQDGGFRTYLGADPEGALVLKEQCDLPIKLDTPFVPSLAVQALSAALARQVPVARAAKGTSLPSAEQLEVALRFVEGHFHTTLLRNVVDEVMRLVMDEQVPPGEIAIVAPFVDDALRFALVTELERYGVPVRTHRPSRALREEPAVRCLLTLAQLVHPQWGMCPPRNDVAQALVQAISDLDWVRASYLTDIVYSTKEHRPCLYPFGQLQPEVQERITFHLGARYSDLLRWMEAYMAETPLPLDLFFSRFFDELLAKPGYGFHNNYDAAAAAANLIESVRKFRWASDVTDINELGMRYIRMVEGGVVAAQYLHGWRPAEQNAVFIAPAYTFLTENRPVDYQFWLDANSLSWGRRLYQPLTHPFVLTRHWPSGRLWSEEDEFLAGQMMLRRVVLGLLRRCRVRVYLGISELNPRGREERGPLLDWVQRMLREVAHAPDFSPIGRGAEEHV